MQKKKKINYQKKTKNTTKSTSKNKKNKKTSKQTNQPDDKLLCVCVKNIEFHSKTTTKIQKKIRKKNNKRKIRGAIAIKLVNF